MTQKPERHAMPRLRLELASESVKDSTRVQDSTKPSARQDREVCDVSLHIDCWEEHLPPEPEKDEGELA